jgi:hypothetical protein
MVLGFYGVQVVGGSNPLAPTNQNKGLSIISVSLSSFGGSLRPVRAGKGQQHSDFRSDEACQGQEKMNSHVYSTQIGIVVQVVGAAYLVFHAWRTARKLGKYKATVTYDNFAHLLDDLAHELSGQFSQQLSSNL